MKTCKSASDSNKDEATANPAKASMEVLGEIFSVHYISSSRYILSSDRSTRCNPLLPCDYFRWGYQKRCI